MYGRACSDRSPRTTAIGHHHEARRIAREGFAVTGHKAATSVGKHKATLPSRPPLEAIFRAATLFHQLDIASSLLVETDDAVCLGQVHGFALLVNTATLHSCEQSGLFNAKREENERIDCGALECPQFAHKCAAIAAHQEGL
eukprot:CAMPEP_0180692304 /NCGR_PEP_ID=MMETSP1038_2-20121128/749_1 /TAXON_ID=632150 /ORGANISM="Azadinium spinosum, Strain 3D9" /LENGTH=141 /DNA_ID=CAMNT_0022723457 /DNA_START=454 /DNA_END=876 /DNA_ORIENTATION=+